MNLSTSSSADGVDEVPFLGNLEEEGELKENSSVGAYYAQVEKTFKKRVTSDKNWGYFEVPKTGRGNITFNPFVALLVGICLGSLIILGLSATFTGSISTSTSTSVLIPPRYGFWSDSMQHDLNCNLRHNEKLIIITGHKTGTVLADSLVHRIKETLN